MTLRLRRRSQKMKKKVLATVIAISLAASCVGCGKAAVQPESSTSEQVEEGAEEGVEEGIEEVTLNVFMDLGANLSSGIQSDPVAEYIREKTGVILNVEGSDPDKAAAMVASGDLYDISILDNPAYIPPLISSKAVADLTDWMQYAPNVTENFHGLIKYSQDYLGNKAEGLFSLPMRAKPISSPLAKDMGGNFVRWNHYVEAGSPEIKSIDDLLDLFETIQKNNPETESGQKAYALSQWMDWGKGSFASAISKYTSRSEDTLFSSYDIDAVEYQDLMNDDNAYLIYADFMFKANQRGILDPEAFVQRHEDYNAKLQDGRVLTTMYQWEINNKNNEFKSVNEAGFVDIPFADTEEFKAKINREAAFGYPQRLLVVSSKCDDTKMRAIMRLIDFLYSEEGTRVMANGPKGVTWNDDGNGGAAFTDETLAAIKEDPSYLVSQGATYYQGIMGVDYDTFDATGETYIDLTLNNDYIVSSLSDYEKEYCEFYGVDVPLDVMTKRENQSTENLAISMLMPTEIPTEIARGTTKIEDYMSQQLPSLILSANQEEYDAKLAAMREELKSMDYETISTFYKEAFENAVASYNELTK